MYAVEYRRFYLRDLESIVVWPSRMWILRPIISGVLLVALSGLLWRWLNFRAGAIVGGVGVASTVLELGLGPTAATRIRTTGASVDLPLVKRTRRAQKVLAKIDAAVRAARGVEQPTPPVTRVQQAELSVQTNSAAPSGNGSRPDGQPP